MEVETEAGMEVAMETGMEVAMEVRKEVEEEAGIEMAVETGKETEIEVAMEVGKEIEMEAGKEMEAEKEVAMELGMELAMEVGNEVETEVENVAEMEVGKEVAMETAMEVRKEVEKEVAMETGVEDAAEETLEPSPPPSPVAAPKKLRRLRKVRETEIKESEVVHEVGVVSEKSGDADVRSGHRESAEEILKRFGKGGDGGNCERGKKRKAVQSTIMAAVVDAAKHKKTVVVSEEVAHVDNVELQSQGEELQSQGEKFQNQGEELQSQGEELQSQEEELAVGSEEMAPLSKKKRSNTVKRCSAHATGLTFESASLGGETEGMDDVEDVPGIDGEINEDDPDGNEDMEDDGGASDSEKGDQGNEEEEGSGFGLSSRWSDGWAGEGLSMDSILAKARQMVAEMSKPAADSAKPTKVKKNSSEEALTGVDDRNVKKKKLSKKEEERMKREEIFAESQRLLRESKGVAFVAPAPITKPVSSVLEKIRQRRLQLGCSDSGSVSSHGVETKLVPRQATKEKSGTYVDLTVDEDTEVEIEIFSLNVVKIEEVKPEDVVIGVQERHTSTQEVSRDKEDVQIADADEKAQDDSACDEKSPGTPEGQKDLSHDDLASSRSGEEDSKLEPSQRILATQDLLCTSQLSPATQESLEAIPFESVVSTATDVLGLDTQLLDEELMLRPTRDVHHLQSKETSSRPPGQSEVYTTATHVRGLIDDEAEDEDEDILAENAEEEEILGDEDDLQDLIASTEKEKTGDKARRDALHRKWLEQQDTEQTEDILERLRTGRSSRWKGRDRVVSCLDEDDDEDLVNTRDSESLDKINLDSQTGADGPFAEEEHVEEPLISLRQRTRSQELEMDCLLDEDEDVEDIAREEPVVEDEIIEDEEEHEQAILRKRLLEESEEQLVFLSPAEDESSREVLSLINKVNVGNLKTKSTAGHSEIRGLGSTSLSSKPSFLGRSSSSSSLPPPAHRQVGAGGSSRSFVFGRDDSNSAHGIPPNQPQEEENPVATKSASVKGVSSTSTVGGKKRSAPQPTSGPSLFEMLKKQSEEHDRGLKTSASAISKKWSSNTEAFSIFASKKSVTLSRRKL